MYKVLSLPRAIVLGLGPVGYEGALMLSKQFSVTGIEHGDKDVRSFKSFNFALSERFLRLAEALQISNSDLPDSAPMYGRAIHPVDSTSAIKTVDYTPDKRRALLSVHRQALNAVLAQKAEKAGVELVYNQDIVSVGFDDKGAINQLWFKDKPEPVVVSPDTFVLVADGANSVVRKCLLQRSSQVDTTVKFPYAYREYAIPADVVKTMPEAFLRSLNSFHIWPKVDFMGGEFFVNALPCAAGGLNICLQGTNDVLKQLKASDIRSLFETHYKDIAPYMKFEEQHHYPLGHFYSRVYSNETITGPNFVLVGDALHPMFPFLGIGVNVGSEDIYILMQALDVLRGKGQSPTSEKGAEFLRQVFKDRILDTDTAVTGSTGNSKNIGGEKQSPEQDAKRWEMLLYLERYSKFFKNPHTMYSFCSSDEIPLREIPWREAYQNKVVDRLIEADFLGKPLSVQREVILTLDSEYAAELARWRDDPSHTPILKSVFMRG